MSEGVLHLFLPLSLPRFELRQWGTRWRSWLRMGRLTGPFPTQTLTNFGGPSLAFHDLRKKPRAVLCGRCESIPGK